MIYSHCRPLGATRTFARLSSTCIFPRRVADLGLARICPARSHVARCTCLSSPPSFVCIAGTSSTSSGLATCSTSSTGLSNHLSAGRGAGLCLCLSGCAHAPSSWGHRPRRPSTTRADPAQRHTVRVERLREGGGRGGGRHALHGFHQPADSGKGVI